MAYFTLELYSPALARDVRVAVLLPAQEAEKGLPYPAQSAPLDGLWLLPRKGGLCTDWLRYARFHTCNGNPYLVILPEDGSGEAYEQFLTAELPDFLAGFGLAAGAEHNHIYAHPDNMDAAAALAARYPAVFGQLIPQPAGNGDWRQADAGLAAFYTAKLEVTIR